MKRLLPVQPQGADGSGPSPDRGISRVEVRETACYICACRCGMRVDLHDGWVRCIETAPDRPRKLVVMVGPAEDHPSNALKTAISKVRHEAG